MIIEIDIDNPFTIEGQPDEGRTIMIDPYDGCQLLCPYCFQRTDPDWNKNIYVKQNIVEVLNKNYSDHSTSEILYFGSKCDPYMQLESTYHLTRKCLEVLKKGTVEVMITTKSDNGLILDDLELLKSFGSRLTVLMGMANINQVGKGINSRNIEIANLLHNNGIKVWAFITPILPYIMDVDSLINALNPKIPIFLDKLRIFSEENLNIEMEDFISSKYPQFISQYQRIIHNNDEEYYYELKKKYCNNPRIKFLFM